MTPQFLAALLAALLTALGIAVVVLIPVWIWDVYRRAEQ